MYKALWVLKVRQYPRRKQQIRRLRRWPRKWIHLSQSSRWAQFTQFCRRSISSSQIRTRLLSPAKRAWAAKIGFTKALTEICKTWTTSSTMLLAETMPSASLLLSQALLDKAKIWLQTRPKLITSSHSSFKQMMPIQQYHRKSGIDQAHTHQACLRQLKHRTKGEVFHRRRHHRYQRKWAVMASQRLRRKARADCKRKRLRKKFTRKQVEGRSARRKNPSTCHKVTMKWPGRRLSTFHPPQAKVGRNSQDYSGN